MLAIVAPYAHDLRGPYRRKQRRLIEGDRVNAARAQSFDIAIRFFGRGKKKPYNRVASRNRLDQTVLRLSVKLKSAVFHRSLSNHTFRISWLNCQLFANFANSNLAFMEPLRLLLRSERSHCLSDPPKRPSTCSACLNERLYRDKPARGRVRH